MKTRPNPRAKFPPSAPTREATGTRRSRASRPPEHYYVGRRPDTRVYVVSRAGIEPLEHHEYRSSAPFDWGAPTPGALELAFAMLTHGTRSTPPDRVCAMFWSDVVARLDHPGFVLGHGDVALWLLTAFADGNEPPPGRRLKLRDRVRRVWPWRRGQ